MNLWRQYTLASRLRPDDRPITDEDLATLSLQWRWWRMLGFLQILHSKRIPTQSTTTLQADNNNALWSADIVATRSHLSYLPMPCLSG